MTEWLNWTELNWTDGILSFSYVTGLCLLVFCWIFLYSGRNQFYHPKMYLFGVRIQFSAVPSHLTLRDPTRCHTPGLPVQCQLPEPTQTHVHWVGNDIQPPHPLLSPSPPAPNPSQHQGLFQWVNSSHEVAKVLEFQLQDLSFQWTPTTDLL